MASDVLGEAYVVPLHDVFQEEKTRLGAESASLAERQAAGVGVRRPDGQAVGRGHGGGATDARGPGRRRSRWWSGSRGWRRGY